MLMKIPASTRSFLISKSSAKMSTLVNYSSEDEEESTAVSKRHKDVNYDDVNMEMSEEENEDKEMQMFSSKEDYQAYKQQFSKSKAQKSPTLEHHRKDQRSEHKRSPESSSRRQRHEDDSRRHHKRRKSRSRSRDRSQRKRDRRSRSRSKSRDRDRHRRHRDHQRQPRGHQDRDRDHNRHQHHHDSRSRKLQSLGLISQASKNEPQTYESQLEKVKELTGVEVPKYYNPHAINPLKYAEQIKKRQMLWSKSSTEASSTSEVNPIVPAPQPALASTSANPSSATSFNKWESTNFGNDKTNEKFRRLMGIKGGSGPASSSSSGPMAAEVPSPGSQIPPRTDKWFADQEQQYERARAITHTQRGLGLGFGSAVPPPAPETAVSMEKKPMNFVKK